MRSTFSKTGKLKAAASGGEADERRNSEDPPSTTTTLDSCSHAADRRRQGNANRPVNNLQLRLDGYEVTALVDPAAGYSVLSESIVRRLRKVAPKWEGPELRTAGGHLITPLGRYTEKVEIAEHGFTVNFVVLPICARDDILGMVFLSENSAIIDLHE